MDQITWPLWLAIIVIVIGGTLFTGRALSRQLSRKQTILHPDGSEEERIWPFYMVYRSALEIVLALMLTCIPSVVVGNVIATLVRSETVNSSMLTTTAVTLAVGLIASFALLSISKVIMTGAMNSREADNDHNVRIMPIVKARFILIIALASAIGGFIGNFVTFIASKF